MKKLGQWIHVRLQKPLQVFFLCIGFCLISLLLNGGLLNLWSLHRDHEKLTEQIEAVKAQTQALNVQLKKAKDPSFIERQAMDRYDLAEENDLVFVFADD